MTLRLKTFGTAHLEQDGVPLGGPHAQKRRLALLAYLAASARPHLSREKLIALLWPESDETGGRHSLSQLLYALRRDLGNDAIHIDAENIGLDHELISSDVREFNREIKASNLERAVELYHGAFLDGFHLDGAPELQRWIDSERLALETACARALEKLAVDSEKQNDWFRARDWWQRVVALDEGNSNAVARYVRALAATGDRQGARRAAQSYEQFVRSEFDEEPDTIVTQLVSALNDAHPIREEVSVHPPPPIDVVLPLRTPASSRPRRRYLMAAVIVLALATTVITAKAFRDSPPEATSASVTIAMGQLSGPDSILSLAVREAVRAQLANTRGVLVTSDIGLRELQSLMRAPDAPLRPPLLLAVAARGGARAAISGSVIPVGEGAQIVIDVLDPANGRSEKTFAENPVDARGILSAAEKLGRSIGQLVSRLPADGSVRALPPVTTASLPALKSYALARQYASRGDRLQALNHAERAVTHDSTFVLAHYMLGDLLWFLDQQSHSDAHLSRAFALRSTVPIREQLMIRARYEQLVRDRPDSALIYWDLLRDASPGDALAYEGKTWALRALGRHEEAAAAADTAMMLDPLAVVPNTNNAMYSWLAVGDTAQALRLAAKVATRNREAPIEATFYAALIRRDLDEAMRIASLSGVPVVRSWRRHLTYLARGDLAGSQRAIDSLIALDQAQHVPRAILNQGVANLAAGNRDAAARDARDALKWLRSRDLSPPAIARLSERIAALAGCAGDETTVRSVIDLVKSRDRGRGLQSYVMAENTANAALAFARGDFSDAAVKAERARHGVYFWRSLLTIVQLEAKARWANHETVRADSLARLIASHQIVDGDFEVWSVLRDRTGHSR